MEQPILMNDAIAFDSHRFVKHMTKAGFTEQQAEAMAEEQVSLLNSDLATEASLAKVDADLKAEIARIDAGLVRVENELKAEIAKVDADLKAEIARLKVEIAKVETTIAGAKTETIKWVAGMLLVQTMVIVGIILAAMVVQTTVMVGMFVG